MKIHKYSWQPSNTWQLVRNLSDSNASFNILQVWDFQGHLTISPSHKALLEQRKQKATRRGQARTSNFRSAVSRRTIKSPTEELNYRALCCELLPARMARSVLA